VARIRVSQASIVGAAAVWLVSIAVAVSVQAVKNPEAAKLKNPTKATPESIAAGQAVYQKYCKFCHNDDAKGDGPLAPKGTHPPNLVDATWDHGSTDGEIFTNIKEGIGPKYDMKAMKAKMMDADIWNVVNYLHSIGPKTK
jgi:mono/diheme cytochrome c family protein